MYPRGPPPGLLPRRGINNTNNHANNDHDHDNNTKHDKTYNNIIIIVIIVLWLIIIIIITLSFIINSHIIMLTRHYYYYYDYYGLLPRRGEAGPLRRLLQGAGGLRMAIGFTVNLSTLCAKSSFICTHWCSCFLLFLLYI